MSPDIILRTKRVLETGESTFASWSARVLRRVQYALGEENSSRFVLLKWFSRLHGPGMFVVINHCGDAVPACFSGVINNKDGLNNICCDCCIHPLQHYNIKAIPQIRISSLKVSRCFDGLLIRRQDDVVKHVVNACLHLEESIP